MPESVLGPAGPYSGTTTVAKLDGRFYEASGVGQQRTGLAAPVFGRITSGFGMRRHPILGYSRMHPGADMAAGSGGTRPSGGSRCASVSG